VTVKRPIERVGQGVAEPGFRVRALGEIAIRCRELDRMARFYGEVLGLERLEGPHRPEIVFFRIAPGYAGHTQVLALFADSGAAAGAGSSLHHLALGLPLDEQAAAVAWLERQGCECRIETFPWIGWRGVFTRDPEGNVVELVAFDPSLERFAVR
jgi:catechol 2,3-dioxygenase-like lactoylglutathione lyase family enzyme